MKQYLISYKGENGTYGYVLIESSNIPDAISIFRTERERHVVTNIYCEEPDIIEWKMIEKEEEPDTDTKWIEDVYKDLNKYYDLTLDMLEDSILSHIPKQWKTQATHEK